MIITHRMNGCRAQHLATKTHGQVTRSSHNFDSNLVNWWAWYDTLHVFFIVEDVRVLQRMYVLSML